MSRVKSTRSGGDPLERGTRAIISYLQHFLQTASKCLSLSLRYHDKPWLKSRCGYGFLSYKIKRFSKNCVVLCQFTHCILSNDVLLNVKDVSPEVTLVSVIDCWMSLGWAGGQDRDCSTAAPALQAVFKVTTLQLWTTLGHYGKTRVWSTLTNTWTFNRHWYVIKM